MTTAVAVRKPRRWVAWLGILGVCAALAWAVVGYRAWVATPEHAAGTRGYPIVAGGDHLYYGSMMLQFTGTPYARALEETADWFGYPLEWERLSNGYIDPKLAPLIYPRTALPLISALFEPLAGLDAILVPGILAAVAVPLAAYLAARRLRSTQWLAVPLILMLLTRCFDENGTGVYPEALLGLCLLGAAATLPWDRRRASVADLSWLTLFIVVGTLTRQMAPAFVGLVGGALLWGLLFDKDRRGWWRVWLAPTALTATIAGAGAVLTQWWAPYDILRWTQASTEASTPSDGLVRGLLRIPSLYATGLGELFVLDPVFPVVLLLGAAATIFVFRHPIVGAFLGAAAPLVLSVGLNGTGPFRYTEPALPILVLVISVALGALSRPELRTSPVAPAPPLARTPRARHPRWVSPALAVTPLVLAAALIAATVVVYQPSRAVDIGDLTAADLNGTWPLTVASLEVSCGGDDGQVWGVTPGGERLSVTGTAMARSPGTASVTSFVQHSATGQPLSAAEVVRVAVARCPVPVPLP